MRRLHDLVLYLLAPIDRGECLTSARFRPYTIVYCERLQLDGWSAALITARCFCAIAGRLHLIAALLIARLITARINCAARHACLKCQRFLEDVGPGGTGERRSAAIYGPRDLARAASEGSLA